jgi:putative transposase
LGNEYSVRELVEDGIERNGLILPISRQAELLGIARRSVYYTPMPVSQKELEIKNQIDVIYTDYPFYGSRKMTVALVKERNEAVNHKRVASYMNQMGLQAVFPRPNLSKNGKQHPVFPYLLRELEITHPNHVWGTDITYIRMHQGFVYLTAIIDWFSRFIVSWKISITLETGFCLEAGTEALKVATPEIMNSDQGVQFTSNEYLDLYLGAGVQVSMDGRGRCMDNIFTERFWRSLKYEEVYLKSYETVAEAIEQIGKYIVFYNTIRPHQSLGYATPADIYFN